MNTNCPDCPKAPYPLRCKCKTKKESKMLYCEKCSNKIGVLSVCQKPSRHSMSEDKKILQRGACHCMKCQKHQQGYFYDKSFKCIVCEPDFVLTIYYNLVSQLTSSNKALEEIKTDKCGMYDLTSDEYGDGVVARCESCDRKSNIAEATLKGIAVEELERLQAIERERAE